MEGKSNALFSKVKVIFTGENKKQQLIIVLGLIGMALILLSELAQPWKSPKQKVQEEEPASNEAYIQQMEQRLTSMVETISGTGKCQVMVTLQQGTEYVYASEGKTTMDHSQNLEGESAKKMEQKDNNESKIVILEQNGTSKALIETKIEPQIKGVVVVCEGGDSAVVKERIVEAVTTVLGIKSNQVCVVPKG